MDEMTLLEAFEYQLAHTTVKPRAPVPVGILEERGGIEYLRKCKNKGYRLRDVSLEVGCATSSIGAYLRKRGLKWSEL